MRTKEQRKRENWLRSYHSVERVKFVSEVLRCHICGKVGENAHCRSGGMGRKADYDTVVSLCAEHHHELHQEGAKSFGAAYGFDLHELAAWVETEWQERVTSTQLTD
jgi:hypothetical protein